MEWVQQNMLTIVTVFGAVMTVVSIWLMLALIRKRELLYHEYDVRTTVFQTEEAGSELTALYDGEQIHDDVTGIQIAIWNEGDKPIMRDHVLEEVRIIPEDDDIHILEPRLVKRSRDVTGFDISASSAQEIPITWDILEEEDGGLIQVIYSGDPDADFKIKGILVEQGNILPSKSVGFFETNSITYIISLYISIFLVATLTFLIHKSIFGINNFESINLIGAYVLLFFFPIKLYFDFKLSPPTPPFNMREN